MVYTPYRGRLPKVGLGLVLGLLMSTSVERELSNYPLVLRFSEKGIKFLEVNRAVTMDVVRRMRKLKAVSPKFCEGESHLADDLHRK